MNYRIRRVPVMRFGMVNAYVIQSDVGAILVDTGIPGCEARFETQLKKMGLNFQDINLIVVTHGHFDHAGNADRLRKLCNAPVLIHQREAKFCAGEAEMELCPTGWVGKLLYASGAPQSPFSYFTPEIAIEGDDQFDLRPYGVPGYVTPTPGHTPGSISVILEDGHAFVSDMVASGLGLGGIVPTGIAKRPPFEEQPQQVATELERLLGVGVQHFHLGHGLKLGPRAIERHIEVLKRLN